MKDPLARISVRYKLALLFVGLCLLTYGLGGFLVSSWAEGALEEQILARLEIQARASSSGLDASLALLLRRSEDFASDGLIRSLTARLQSALPDDERAAVASELRRHLSVNKLPLVTAFADLAVASPSGELLVAVHDDPRLGAAMRDPTGPQADATWVSGIVGSGVEPDRPGLLLSTPLHGVESARVVGRLLVLVQVEDWLMPVILAAAEDELGSEAQLALRDESGLSIEAVRDAGRAVPLLQLVRSATGARERTGAIGVRATLSRAFPLSVRGLSVEVTQDVGDALLPVSGLRSRFVGIGLLLGLISTLLLYFPMRFLAHPLVELTRAAERLREGDLATRVPVESDDEIGALSRSFNGMAEAIGERTSRLVTAAAELRASEGEVREGRDRLAAVISSMRDGLIVLDTAGRVAMANAAARPLVDLVADGETARAHHLCRDGAASVSPEAPGDLAPRSADRGRGSGCLDCLVEPSGPPRSCMIDVGARTFEVHTTLLPTDGAGRRGRVLVSREVTDRILQDEREMHNERLAVLGEVAAVVAHEINNPLASISMFNQMLAAELPDDSPLRENTEVIGRNTEAAKRTIRELLDYATGAGPEVCVLDVHDLLEDVLRFLGPLSKRAGVEVRLEPQATRSEIRGDEVQLRQVFVNLTLNAIQAMAPEGRVGEPQQAVVLATRDESDRLVVSVRDSGPGIPPEARERIFRPFFTTKPRGEGTGLGLPTARRIAETHGGSLALVESSPSGTVFEVRLRACTTAEVAS